MPEDLFDSEELSVGNYARDSDNDAFDSKATTCLEPTDAWNMATKVEGFYVVGDASR
jgi:hypothetical protein